MKTADTYIRQTHQYEDPFYIFLGEDADDPASHYKYIGKSGTGNVEIEESCAFQLEFLKTQGLRKVHTLMDLGCGSLRAGIRFMPFLNTGNYLGIDISKEALRRGIEDEVGFDLIDEKRPEFVLSDAWEFNLFSKKPNYIIANSVFTHLRTENTKLCFESLQSYLQEAPFQFFATFTQSLEEKPRQPPIDHYYGGTGACTYSVEQFAALGEAQGWKHDFIGDWGHFRNKAESPIVKFQMMMRFYRD